MRSFIEIGSRLDHVDQPKPYDFEIRPGNGALKEYCLDCQTPLLEEEKWMKKALLDAMRISLFLHGRVRLIHCGRCGKAPCAERVMKWLMTQEPLCLTSFLHIKQETLPQMNLDILPHLKEGEDVKKESDSS